MPTQDEALASEPRTTTVYHSFDDGDVLDDRIAQLVELEELNLAQVPADLVLPETLLTLPKLRMLWLRPAKGQRLVVPALVTRSGITRLEVSDVDIATMPVPPGLRELKLRTNDIAGDITLVARHLPGLTLLEIYAEDDVGAVAIPEAIAGLLNLETLIVSACSITSWPASLSSMTALRSLTFTSADLEGTVGTVGRSLPALTSLQLFGPGPDQGPQRLPDDIGALASLRSLAIHRANLPALPASFQALRSLRELTLDLRPFKVLPDAVGGLVGLEKLTVDYAINGLPASLGALTSLRELDLSQALNGGAMVSRSDDLTRLKALPKVLAELTSLEKLNLDHCGVFDAAPLRALRNLHELSISWSGLTTLDDIGAIESLEVLGLEHLDRVRDLTPLKDLKKLRDLNLEGVKTQHLEVLRALPSLRRLNLESARIKNMEGLYAADVELEADDDVKERYQQRAALRALPEISTIVTDLGSDDIAIVQTAMANLATWTEASSSRDDSMRPPERRMTRR